MSPCCWVQNVRHAGSLTSYSTQSGQRWKFQIYVPKDPERPELGDTRLTRGGFKSLDEAQRALAAALTKRKSDARFQSKTPTIGEYADHWIAGLRLQNSTVEGYKKIIRNHVTPHLGTIRLDKLTATRIAAHYRQLESSGRRDKPGRGKPLSLLIVDIDYFKAVNDTYGHEAGDEVLREFANRVRSTVRGADLACRYGGEEFVVVMPDTSPETAAQVAERLRLVVEMNPFQLRQIGISINVTASLGISSTAWVKDSPKQLLRHADRALYDAKHAGRNRVVAAAA